MTGITPVSATDFKESNIEFNVIFHFIIKVQVQTASIISPLFI